MSKDKTQPEALDDEALDDAQGGLLLPAVQQAKPPEHLAPEELGLAGAGGDGATGDAPPEREHVTFAFRKI